MTLNSVLDGAVAVVMPAVEHAGQTLNVSMPNDPVWVHADATRLQQVFSTLLTNASKFTDRRGHVSLRVALTGGTVVVRVSDNGRGIAADVLPHIVDLFAQAGVDERGLGIGLSVVHGSLARHRLFVAAHPRAVFPATGLAASDIWGPFEFLQSY
jgi:two-component system, sensor histidine kinase